MTNFDLPTVGPAITLMIPRRRCRGPMSQAYAFVGGRRGGGDLSGETEAGNGCVGISKSFGEAFVGADKAFHRIVLLDGGVCKIVKRARHQRGLFDVG